MIPPQNVIASCMHACFFPPCPSCSLSNDQDLLSLAEKSLVLLLGLDEGLLEEVGVWNNH